MHSNKLTLLLLVSIFAFVTTAHASVRTSNFAPPASSDRIYVVDDGSTLDTGCRFKDQGPITFEVKIDRVVSKLLISLEPLVQAGVLSPYATLRIPAYDVDVNANYPGVAPELNEVFFNGKSVGYLDGDNEIWTVNEFQIPINDVNFGTYQGNNQNPIPGINTVQIKIDVGNAYPTWCTSIDWGLVAFKAISPVALIHGLGDVGGSNMFKVQEFIDALDNKFILYDNNIQVLDSSYHEVPPPQAGKILAQQENLPRIAKEFGVDSLHIVGHSKGGLDLRAYLAAFYQAQDSDFRVISYTSLDSPHAGSALADYYTAHSAATQNDYSYMMSVFPDSVDWLPDAVIASVVLSIYGGQTSSNQSAHISLSTSAMSSFNAANTAYLSPFPTYNFVAADTDRNGNREIEYIEYKDDLLKLFPNNTIPGAVMPIANTPITLDSYIVGSGVNFMYGLLGEIKHAELTYEEDEDGLGNGGWWIEGTPYADENRAENDLFVTVDSALGVDTNGVNVVGYQADNTHFFDGTTGRSHLGVANKDSAKTVVIPWIIEVEKNHESGDFSPLP